MKKIKVISWTETDKTGNEIETDTTSLLDMMIKMIKPEHQPKGLDLFRTMNRLVKAFRKAKKTKLLELEEQDYKFLKDNVEKDIPAMWGSIEKANEAIEEFMNPKEEQEEVKENVSE